MFFGNRENEISRLNAGLETEKRTVLMLQEWLRLRERGESIAHILESRGIKKIVIYGMEENGQLLLSELRGSGVQALSAVDLRAVGIRADIEVLKPGDFDPDKSGADAILVTELSRVSEAKEHYSGWDGQVISLEEILL